MTQNETLRTKLMEEKALLEAELSKFGVLENKETGNWEAVPATQDAPEADENDRADRAQNFEERSATVDQLELRLVDVKNALARMDAGTYGICKVCNMQIEAERLEANPAADTCITHREL